MKPYIFKLLFIFLVFCIPIVAKSQTDLIQNLNNKAQIYNGGLDFNLYTFIENQGQWDEKVLFMAKAKSMTVWITNEGVLFDQIRENKSKNNGKHTEVDVISKVNYQRHVVALNYVNSSVFKLNKKSLKQNSFNINYFLGNDNTKHVAHAKQYEELLFENIYQGIDIRYYFDQGELRYDFIVEPGADPNQIEFEIDGEDTVRVKDNELIIETSLQPIIQKDLLSYQENKKNKIVSEFEIDGKYLKFNISEYDKSKILIIDPLT